MKKTRFIALLVTVLYILNSFSFVSYAAPADEHKKYTKLLYENDFDSAESFAAWTLGVAAENKPNMHHQVSGTNYAMALFDETAQTGKNFNIKPSTLSDGKTNVMFEFDMNVSNTATRYVRYYNSEGSNRNGNQMILRINGADSQMLLYDAKKSSSQYSSAVSYTPDASGYVSIRVIVDFDNGKSMLYLKESGNYVFKSQWTITTTGLAANMKNIVGFGVDTASKSETGVSYTDNLKIYEYEDVKVETIYPANGATDFPRNGKIEMICNRTILDDEKTVTMTESISGNPVANATPTFNDKTITVNFSGNLAKGTTYTITYGTQNFTFTTADSDIITTLPAITENSAGSYTATATAVKDDNSAVAAETATLVLVVYDQNNKLRALQTDNQAPFTVTAAATNVQSGETFTAQAFWIDNMTSKKLLRRDFAQSDVTNAKWSYAGMSSSSFDSFSVVPNGDAVNVHATIPSTEERIVLFHAVKGSTTDQFRLIKTANVNSKGDLNYTFNPSSGNGNYTIYLSGAKVTSGEPKTLFYIDSASQDDIYNELTNSSNPSYPTTAEETGTFLNSYSVELNLESEYFTDNAYQYVFEQRDTISSFGEIPQMMKDAKALMDNLTVKDWTELSAYIDANESALINGNVEVWDYYDSLSEAQQNVVNKKIDISSVTSIYDFREKLTDAVGAYQQELAAQEEENQEIYDQTSSITSSGGGGGGGSYTPPVVPVVPVTPPASPSGYSDTGSVPWAEEGIAFLSNRGIISGDGTGNFLPLDFVKREEFVKMLVTMFGMEGDAANCEFNDADKSAWYAPYLAAAKEAGIITGKQDGSFGIGDSISRQDMALMLWRALEIADKTINGDAKEPFADSGEIDGYAYDAVLALYNAGLISGVGEGNFAPADTANRAQAATILFNLFNKGVMQ